MPDAKIRATSERKAPWFGVLSLVVPIVGLPLAFGVGLAIASDFLVGIGVLLYGGLALAFLGFVLGVVGMIRGERMRLLSLLSCTICGLPLLWTLISAFTTRSSNTHTFNPAP